MALNTSHSTAPICKDETLRAVDVAQQLDNNDAGFNAGILLLSAGRSVVDAAESAKNAAVLDLSPANNWIRPARSHSAAPIGVAVWGRGSAPGVLPDGERDSTFFNTPAVVVQGIEVVRAAVH